MVKKPQTKTTSRKPAAKPATSTGVAPATDVVKEAPGVTIVATDEPVIAGPVLRKNVLIDRVVTQSGIKKKDAKPVIEAMLTVLGEAISQGEELNLPGFGKLKVNRAKELSNGKVMVCKIRQPKRPVEV